jgi:hypothetical protein
MQSGYPAQPGVGVHWCEVHTRAHPQRPLCHTVSPSMQGSFFDQKFYATFFLAPDAQEPSGKVLPAQRTSQGQSGPGLQHQSTRQAWDDGLGSPSRWVLVSLGRGHTTRVGQIPALVAVCSACRESLVHRGDMTGKI